MMLGFIIAIWVFLIGIFVELHWIREILEKKGEK